MKVNQKNKTRIGISLLCAIILLTGCHITPNKKQDGEKKKYPKLVVVYSDAYGEDSSFSQVQEEINKITRKKLGVEVEFHLISDSNYSDAVELMLTSGEQVDILWGSNSLFVKAYVNRQLCDLEPLLKENGKDIIDAVGWKYINCCRIGGTLYGLPNNRDFAAGWDSYALRKDILNKYNIKASDIKNIKDLEKVFDLVLDILLHLHEDLDIPLHNYQELQKPILFLSNDKVLQQCRLSLFHLHNDKWSLKG